MLSSKYPLLIVIYYTNLDIYSRQIGKHPDYLGLPESSSSAASSSTAGGLIGVSALPVTAKNIAWQDKSADWEDIHLNDPVQEYELEGLMNELEGFKDFEESLEGYVPPDNPAEAMLVSNINQVYFIFIFLLEKY